MATLSCGSCGWENESDEVLCLRCSRPLADDPPVAEADRARGPVDPEPVDPEPVYERCPHCDAELPDPTNRVCVECQRPFQAIAAGTPPSSPPEPDPRIAGTRRDHRSGARLRLTFTAAGKRLGEIDVGLDEQLMVGREPVSECALLIGSWDNISRRHAMVGLDADRVAWVRDEYSTNGTMVNDVPVRPGRRSVLRSGDRLQFGADVAADVTCEGVS